MKPTRRQRKAALNEARNRQACERAAARWRLLDMAVTGQPTPATPRPPVSMKAATS